MVDANILAEKLKQLFRRIEKVRANCPVDPRDLAPDSDALDIVSFNLLLAVQTCVDLATHLIAGAAMMAFVMPASAANMIGNCEVSGAFDAALEVQLSGRALPPEVIAAVDEAAARVLAMKASLARPCVRVRVVPEQTRGE